MLTLSPVMVERRLCCMAQRPEANLATRLGSLFLRYLAGVMLQ